ncbi:MAG TPA: hypothetical protein VMB22_08775 [Verrucomicrobiae bacterium]|nr:hypothetical protein [Verrucomicrobiae bacterium]
MTADRDQQRSDKQTAQQDAATTHAKLNQTVSQLNQTKQDLADANSKREAAEQAEAVAEKKADDLSGQLNDANKQLNDAQTKLAQYEATGLTPDQVTKLNDVVKADEKAVAALNDENTVLTREVEHLKTELAYYQGTNQDILLPADLEGQVLVVDPKWDFVVLNIGDDQGVIQDGQLLVSREGKLVAKVVVRSVDKDHCIANIMPGWKLGPVIEGDIVTPAHPKPAT